MTRASIDATLVDHFANGNRGWNFKNNQEMRTA